MLAKLRAETAELQCQHEQKRNEDWYERNQEAEQELETVQASVSISNFRRVWTTWRVCESELACQRHGKHAPDRGEAP